MVFNGSFYEEAWNEWKDMKRYGPMSRHIRRLIKEMLCDISFKSILDVGCGEGSLLVDILSYRGEVEVSGIDISERALTISRERVKKGRFYRIDIQKETLDERFDLVICSEVLEHLRNDRMALVNLKKMTKRYLLITIPIGKMRQHERRVGHLRNYILSEFIDMLLEEGFKIVKVVEWGFPFYSPLYRSLLNYIPYGVTTGRFGILRRVISFFLYSLFCLNSRKKGDLLILLAEK
jgi:2-polyprenyl-3-methyl-5-hydroxy-6-metoxy-1,4-benzoquinol methylase